VPSIKADVQTMRFPVVTLSTPRLNRRAELTGPMPTTAYVHTEDEMVGNCLGPPPGGWWRAELGGRA
jgi:hypothetical protein